MKDWNYNLRRGFVWQILVALLIATPVSVSATTTSGQVSVDTDDAEQDGIGSTTQLFSSPHAPGMDRHNGYRFTGLPVPDDAVILSASIQFTTESSNTGGSPSGKCTTRYCKRCGLGNFVLSKDALTGYLKWGEDPS